MATVLVTDSVHGVCAELLAEAGIESLVALKKSTDELKRLSASVDGWIVRSGTTITAEMIDAAASLRVIGRAGVGVDNVDVEAATRRGILVINAPAGNTISTAEHTVAMLLALSRRLAPASASLREGLWERKEFTGTELYGKTIGIVGAGKIGQAVAERVRGFGMSVLAFDPLLSREAADRSGITLVPFEELVDRADYITVHTPLNNATRGLFDTDTISRCRPGVRFINCARGGIIDEEALHAALVSGHVAGAALDVYSAEPPPEALSGLLRHPNVLATPHIAASTDEAQEKVARQVTEQVIHALKDEPVSTAVNGMAVRLASSREVQPLLDLADRLGRVGQQLAGDRLDRVLLRCHGDVPRRYAEVLLVSTLKGIMSGLVTGPVNLVNAKVLAEETGLTTDVATFADEGAWTQLLELVLEAGSARVRVAGTIVGSEDPRIVRIDGFDVELRAAGELLFYRNVDRPGMLASVGALLAGGGVNIAGLALGRRTRGETALTAMSLDEPVPATVLEQIRSLDGVLDVRTAKI